MRIFVISDLHFPYAHPRAIAFIDSCIKKYKPDRILLTGDELDLHSISFHSHDPDLLFSPSAELARGIEWMKELYKIIPEADVLNSNHSSLGYRKLKFHGLPRSLAMPWNVVLEAPPRWNWHDELIIDDIYFHHGDLNGKLQRMVLMDKNICIGHRHSEFKIEYFKSGAGKLRWGMTVGCLIDDKSLAFAYNKNTLARPILGCGLIIDGIPFLIPMLDQ